MVTRTTEMVYKTSGAQRATAEIIPLTRAIDQQRSAAQTLAKAHDQVARSHSAVSSVARESRNELVLMAGALGPVGAGLAEIAARAPAAITGIVGIGAAQDRANVLSRSLNATLLTGTGILTVGAVAAAAYTHTLIEKADAYQSLTAKIRIYTEGQLQAKGVEEQLYAASARARSGMENTTKLFSRLQPALADTGRSPEQAVKIAETVSKTLAIQGATGQESTYGIIDFIHGLGTGSLQNRQLRGLQTETPVLLRYIAQNFQAKEGGPVGVPYSSLHELAAKKQLTTAKVLDALERAGPQIEKDFTNAPRTAAQAWTVLNDKVTRFIGTVGLATGAQQGLVQWLAKLGEEADKFRKEVLFDPKAMENVERFTHFIGDAVNSIGTLGKVGVENFDSIVTAGQLVISLKLGEVMATWFSKAAQAAKAALVEVKDFGRSAIMAAGGAANPQAAAQATLMRAQATEQAARAAALEEAATRKSSQATQQRALADRLATTASEAKTAATLAATEVEATERAATEAQTKAERSEAQAAVATARAKAAEIAAREANTLAAEAEAVVWEEATLAKTASIVATQALTAAYTALGGAIGIATLLIGALIYTYYQEKQRLDEVANATQQLAAIKSGLARIEDQLVNATEGRISILRRERAELVQNTQAELENARAKAAGLRASAAKARASVPLNLAFQGLSLGAYTGGTDAMRAADAMKREADANEKAADKIEDALNHLKAGTPTFNLRTDTRLNEILRQRIESGTDATGARLSAAQIAADKAKLAATQKVAEQDVNAADAAKKKADADLDAAKKSGNRARIAAASTAASTAQDRLDAADEKLASTRLHQAADIDEEGKKHHKARGMVNSALEKGLKALDEIAQFGDAMKAAIAKIDDFAIKGGKVMDMTTGQPFRARSKDEAKAAADYLETVREIERASGKEQAAMAVRMGRPGASKAEMEQAVEDLFKYKLATSEAAKADEAWLALKVRVGLADEAEGSVLQQVNKFLAQHKDMAFADAQEMQRRAAVLDRAKEAAKAVKAVEPFTGRAVDDVMASTITPTTATGGVDALAAVRQLEEHKAEIVLEVQRQVQAHLDQLHRDGDLTDTQYAKQSAEDAAAAETAVTIELEKRKLDIKKQGARDAAQYTEDEIRQAASTIGGAFKDLILSPLTGTSISDIGKRMAIDLLTAIYDELIGNPLNAAIRAWLHNLFNSSGGAGGGGGGFWSSLFSSIGSIFGMGGASSTTATLHEGVHGFDTGGSFVVNGRGGRDTNLVMLRATKGERIDISTPEQVRYGAATQSGPIMVSMPPPPPARGDVIVNNHTGVAADAKVSKNERGDQIIDLVPLGEQMIEGAGRSGSLYRGLMKSPPPVTKRG